MCHPERSKTPSGLRSRSFGEGGYDPIQNRRAKRGRDLRTNLVGLLLKELLFLKKANCILTDPEKGEYDALFEI